MAAIDKTYIQHKWQYEQVKEWCKDKSFTLKNGDLIRPSDYIRCTLEEVDWGKMESENGETPLWSTPAYLDMWLYKNCPIDFIQERLKEQYGDIENEYNQYNSFVRPEPSVKFKITKKGFRYKGKYWNRRHRQYVKQAYFVEVYDKDDNMLWYNEEHDAFYCDGENLPINSSCAAMFNPSKRKIARLVKKWKLFKGCKIHISGRFLGKEYKVCIK